MEEGIAELGAGLAARDSIREFGAQPHYRAWLAEACARIGHAQEGLDLITPYLNKEHDVLVYEPEVHLARASLLLVQDPHQHGGCYRQRQDRDRNREEV